MTARLLLLALVVAAAGRAQLQLYSVVGTTEQPVGGTLDLGRTLTGDALERKLRLRNTTTASVVLRTLRSDGSGFRVQGEPELPFTLAAGFSVDFTVRFAPVQPGQYSASLLVNTASTLLLAAAQGAATLLLEEGGVPTPVPASGVDLGRVERGQVGRRRLLLQNRTDGPVNVATLNVTGAGFRLASLPPTTLGAGGSAAFDVEFAPTVAGVARGTLRWGERDIVLSGIGLDPPHSLPSVIVSSTNARSAEQIPVSVRLTTPSRRTGSGTLTLEPRPTGGGEDATIQFVRAGARLVAFTVVEGDTEVTFADGSRAVTLQTGLLAGDLVLTAILGDFRERATIRVAAAAPVVDTSRLVRDGASLDLRLVGYDNTRDTRRVRCTFYDRAGQVVGGGAMAVEVAEAFRAHYAASTLGGAFALRLVFPVQGDAGGIAAVEAEVVGGAGTTAVPRLALP